MNKLKLILDEESLRDINFAVMLRETKVFKLYPTDSEGNVIEVSVELEYEDDDK